MRQQTTKGATVNILNIGLNKASGGTLDVRAVYAALTGHRAVWCAHGVHTSDTERTLVLTCAPLPATIAHALSVALDQDCIAVWDTAQQSGRLIGPRAADWGTFNPAFFILPNGERLA